MLSEYVEIKSSQSRGKFHSGKESACCCAGRAASCGSAPDPTQARFFNDILSNAPTAALSEKMKELVRLAKEQGYLTYSDISDALPGNVTEPEQLDEIINKLRSLDIEIMDQAEVDRVKTGESDEDDASRLDALDDPVRMYLKQMGQVALLTREQEVLISKRIEAAENEMRKIIYGFGFAGKEQIALAEKLVADPPRERFDRVVLEKKANNRNAHLRVLRKLIKQVHKIDRAGGS